MYMDMCIFQCYFSIFHFGCFYKILNFWKKNFPEFIFSGDVPISFQLFQTTTTLLRVLLDV